MRMRYIGVRYTAGSNVRTNYHIVIDKNYGGTNSVKGFQASSTDFDNSPRFGSHELPMFGGTQCE